MSKSTLILAIVAVAALSPSTHGQSQAEMNADAAADFEKADAQLQTTYKKLLESLDPDGRKKLKASQRAWTSYREAQAEFQGDDEASGGSLFPLIFFGTKTRITEARIKELQEFLVPYEDR